jgi:hypothetical protein
MGVNVRAVQGDAADLADIDRIYQAGQKAAASMC